MEMEGKMNTVIVCQDWYDNFFVECGDSIEFPLSILQSYGETREEEKEYHIFKKLKEGSPIYQMMMICKKASYLI